MHIRHIATNHTLMAIGSLGPQRALPVEFQREMYYALHPRPETP